MMGERGHFGTRAKSATRLSMSYSSVENPSLVSPIYTGDCTTQGLCSGHRSEDAHEIRRLHWQQLFGKPLYCAPKRTEI
jgi:hypothetical protein